MKGRQHLKELLLVIMLSGLLLPYSLMAQYTIHANDIPSDVGTLIITEDDVMDNLEVDVGRDGMNRAWYFTKPYKSVMRRQLILEKNSVPFNVEFPEANIGTRYFGKIGELIHTWYFDQIEGEMFIFQNKTNDDLSIKGIGINSPTFTGTIKMQSDIVLHQFPLTYGNKWNSVSETTIKLDTIFFGKKVELRADLHDSIYSVADGVGEIFLPDASYKCLRVKCNITLTEKLFIDNRPFRTKKHRTVNYYWITKKYGVVTRILSHCNEVDEAFVLAKQVSRLFVIDPEVRLTVEDYSGGASETITIPIQISDVTGLDIHSLKFTITSDEIAVQPISV
ncbi:hypothetical protein JW964_22060, partial [candidate division KSB1 bacterium]|nr:hypothetical protein [candidate division KSB1 bacterium]